MVSFFLRTWNNELETLHILYPRLFSIYKCCIQNTGTVWLVVTNKIKNKSKKSHNIHVTLRGKHSLVPGQEMDTVLHSHPFLQGSDWKLLPAGYNSVLFWNGWLRPQSHHWDSVLFPLLGVSCRDLICSGRKQNFGGWYHLYSTSRKSSSALEFEQAGSPYSRSFGGCSSAFCILHLFTGIWYSLTCLSSSFLLKNVPSAASFEVLALDSIWRVDAASGEGTSRRRKGQETYQHKSFRARKDTDTVCPKLPGGTCDKVTSHSGGLFYLLKSWDLPDFWEIWGTTL